MDILETIVISYIKDICRQVGEISELNRIREATRDKITGEKRNVPADTGSSAN